MNTTASSIKDTHVLSPLGGVNRSRVSRFVLGVTVATTLAVTAGCADSFSRDPADICSFLAAKSGWFPKLEKAASSWKVPESVILAFLQHESLFDAEARPPRRRILWVIPGPRRSSAYGYAQALDSTWSAYKKDTGRKGADRDDFGDATDFVGWYINNTNQATGVAKTDAYNQYLAYHEGAGGYKRGSWKRKKWLVDVARKVTRKSEIYSRQLAACTEKQRKPRRRWWPFG